MSTIEVALVLDRDGVHIYAVEVIEDNATFSYTVELSDEYYAELTQGKISQVDLVRKAFIFLLSQESPEAILKEFDLKMIEHYFPAFPEYIRKDIGLLK